MKSLKMKNGGFTLIELLIVIGIVAVLAASIYVAVNPEKRFKETRDAKRYSDIKNIDDAIKLYSVDNGHVPYLQSHCSPSSPDTNCFTNDTTGAPYPWSYLEQDLADYLAELPRDPCGVDCAADGHWYTYNYYSPSAYYAACLDGGNCGPTGSMTESDAAQMYSLYAEHLEMEDISWGVSRNQFHSY